VNDRGNCIVNKEQLEGRDGGGGNRFVGDRGTRHVEHRAAAAAASVHACQAQADAFHTTGYPDCLNLRLQQHD